MHEEMNNVVCIYHANCSDGFGAAWALWKCYPDADFYPVLYNTP